MRSIILARVSTEEQREAGNSLPAQLERMKEYCKCKNFDVVEVFEFDESAYKDKRDEFDKVLQFLVGKSEKFAICFDKVDRLSRNVFDKRVSELYEKAVADEIELHFVSDGQVINSSMSAIDKFQFGMSLGLAKYYSDAISDNVKRAFEQKRRNGEWTGPSPFGYKSIPLDESKRTRSNIIFHETHAEMVRELFERYVTGDFSCKVLAEDLSKRGFKTRAGGNISTSHINAILSNTFYYGEAYSKKYDVRYQHNYKPIITKKLWEKVRDIREGRSKSSTQSNRKKEFIFSGLLKCQNCGCSITGEMKKGKYIYYSCTNAKGICKREYMTEKSLLKPIKKSLSKIKLTDDQKDKIVEFLKEHHTNESKYHKNRINRLRGEYDNLQTKLESLLDLMVDKVITKKDYAKKLRDYKSSQELIGVELEELTNADGDYHITAGLVLSLAQRAEELFESSDPVEKRQLLKCILQNPVVKEKKLVYSLRSPFDVIANVDDLTLLRGQDSNL